MWSKVWGTPIVPQLVLISLIKPISSSISLTLAHSARNISICANIDVEIFHLFMTSARGLSLSSFLVCKKKANKTKMQHKTINRKNSADVVMIYSPKFGKIIEKKLIALKNNNEHRNPKGYGFFT